MKKKFKAMTVPFARKRKGKTDYRARLIMLASPARVVVRKSGKNVVAQAIVSEEGKDKIVASAHSRELLKMGWQFSRKNIPASYLVGLLIGKKAQKAGLKKAVLDIGLFRSVKGSRLYAVAKGAIDAGLEMPADNGVMPTQDRIEGKHITEFYKQGNFTKVQFSKSKPENMADAFKKMKAEITNI